MFQRKITLKLYLLITLSMTLLVGISIVGQMFIVNRMYLTTEYTKERENILINGMDYIIKQYNAASAKGDKEKIEMVINKYANQNSAYCYIFDKTYKIEYLSSDAGKLEEIYINNIKKTLCSEEESLKWSRSFRINGALNFPSKYIAVYRPIYASDRSDIINEYFVIVTSEVYTNENHLVLRKYSIYLFIIVIILASILALVFSYIITRPILKIRDTAARMINLEFNEKCDYKANDEIGDLSNSINFLSEKLNNTINQLHEANDNLKGDLDVQKEIDQLRKDFIGDVSHEFKTPLTLIRGFNEMIIDKRLNEEELQEAHSVIMDEVDKMDKLVQELLDLSKLESASYELKREKFDCIELLRTIANRCSIIADQRNVHFCFKQNDEDIFVYADKSRIEQVIMNFITNAIFNTPENKNIVLKAETQKESVIISVFNEGSKINENEIHRIWEKFYRSDKSRSKKTGGTGLGLAICRQILEKHESLYGVQNVENGVQFYFVLNTKK